MDEVAPIPCLPLEGKVSAKPTDEVKHYSLLYERDAKTVILFSEHISFYSIFNKMNVM